MFLLIHLFRETRTPLFLLLSTVVLGAIGYKLLYPEADWSRIIFMVAVTFTTVGYSDILQVEKNPAAIVYTIFIMFIGMGSVLYAVSKITAFIIEGDLKEIFAEEKTNRSVSKMKNHYIICGAGQTGIHVVHEMQKTQQSFVIIDQNKDLLKQIRPAFKSCPIIEGDATNDSFLHKANIKQAEGLVATLSNDKDNLFLTITAKLLNPKLKIVSKAIDIDIKEKLQKAGANYIVSPNLIGGLRIASEILRPHVVSFLDQMLMGGNESIRAEEVVIHENSPLVGHTLQTAKIYEKTELVVTAVKLKGSFIYNPSPNTKILENMVLLVISNPKQHKKLLSLSHGYKS